MKPTRPGVLLALVVLAGSALVVLITSLGWDVPVVPWSLPGTLLLVTAGVLVGSLSFRRRLRGSADAPPLDPLHAARMAVLAKACSHAGALLGGAYGGIAVGLLLHSSSEARRGDAVVAGCAALAALALAGVGLLLERWCRLPPRQEPPPAAEDDIDIHVPPH